MGPMLQEARLLATPSRTEGTSLSEGDLIRGREILGDFLGDFAVAAHSAPRCKVVMNRRNS